MEERINGVSVGEEEREGVQLPDSVTYICVLSGSIDKLQERIARGVNLNPQISMHFFNFSILLSLSSFRIISQVLFRTSAICANGIQTIWLCFLASETNFSLSLRLQWVAY